jgi:hypothetical protein
MLRKEMIKNIKERRKIYAARDFSDKIYLILFKYPIKFEIAYYFLKNNFFFI